MGFLGFVEWTSKVFAKLIEDIHLGSVGDDLDCWYEHGLMCLGLVLVGFRIPGNNIRS